ncbi:hypothetical protein EDD22DRAFT_951400 [Suillus occidentalis]|nr:hypothetical protein EDD22DRAFT_951400 [Suillus occidentalis]
MSSSVGGGEVGKEVFRVLSAKFIAFPFEFWAASAPVSMVVTAAVDTLEGFVGIAVRGVMVVGIGATDVSADVAVAGNVFMSLAFGTVVVNVEAVLDYFGGSIHVIDLNGGEGHHWMENYLCGGLIHLIKQHLLRADQECQTREKAQHMQELLAEAQLEAAHGNIDSMDFGDHFDPSGDMDFLNDDIDEPVRG